MDRWLGRLTNAGAAARDPEEMDDVELKAYLEARGQTVGDRATHQVLRATLGKLQYLRLAILCKPSDRDHDPVEQNTPAWYFMRRGPHKMRVGGSEVSVIVGIDGFAKAYSLYDKICKQQDGLWPKEEGSPAPCVHGNTCEDMIADVFAEKMEYTLLPGGYYRHSDPDLGHFYGASPDRLVLSKDARTDGAPVGEVCALLEIKAPYGRMYQEVKPEHMAQMQFQMWVGGVPRCYYLAIKLRHDAEDEMGTGYGPRSTPPRETKVLLAVVHYSAEFVAWMIPRLFYFTKCVAERTEPPHDLYDNEASGYEAPPIPRVEYVTVPMGSWRVVANPRGVGPGRPAAAVGASAGASASAAAAAAGSAAYADTTSVGTKRDADGADL